MGNFNKAYIQQWIKPANKRLFKFNIEKILFYKIGENNFLFLFFIPYSLNGLKGN
jgi:hypothetical protein